MLIGDVMTADVETVHPDETVQVAAQLMAERDVGALPAVDGEVLKGIVTDRDLIIRVVAEARDPSGTRVADVMSSTLFSCGPDDSIESAVKEMGKRQIRRMPVVDAEYHLLGIVTLKDLLRAGAVDTPTHGQQTDAAAAAEPDNPLPRRA